MRYLQKMHEARPQQDLNHLLDHRLIILIGKGGVGKTVVSTVLAMIAAKMGKRVLLGEVRSEKIPRLFGQNPNTEGTHPLAPNLTWINLTTRSALETYVMQKIKIRAVYRAVFEHPMVRRFLRAVPSLSEILILGHICYFLEQESHDIFVLDAPSTGPGALMLQAPDAIYSTASPGPLKEGAQWIKTTIADREKTAIHLVTTPEELPVDESFALFRHFTEEKMPLGSLIINRCIAKKRQMAPQLLDILANYTSSQAIKTAWDDYNSHVDSQKDQRQRLQGINLPGLIIPEVISSSESQLLEDLRNELTTG
jgi:anion-transporting  ArsA/GET3 family ATPase